MNSDRIRWGHDEPGDGAILDGSTGSVGTLPLAAFHIWKAPQYGGELVLTSDLPGQEGRRSFGSDPDELKATAERWLSEFISSLGAVFGDAIAADLRSRANDLEAMAGHDTAHERDNLLFAAGLKRAADLIEHGDVPAEAEPAKETGQ